MRILSALFANLFLLAAALGYGGCLRPLFPESYSQLERAALIWLGGLGLLGTLLFLVGQVWFSISAIVLVLLVGALLALPPGVSTARKFITKRPKFRIPRLPGLVIAAVMLVTVVGGLAEPTGDIKMDTIAYHYLGPRVWLRNHLIRPVIDECLTAFPAIVETQYAALMALGGQRAPDFFSVIGLVSMMLIAAALALRMGLGADDAWWVVALIVTMPVLYRGVFGGFIDVVYSGLILAAARIGFDARRPREFALFGVFCGLAMGTKYNALVAVVLLAPCVFFFHSSSEEFGGKHDRPFIVKGLTIASLTASVVAAPWYLRDWILLGSPIYPPPPFLAKFVHPKYLPPQAIRNLIERGFKEAAGMGQGPLSFLLLPFHLTFHPANFMNGAGGIGLVPLILAPFGLLACPKDRFAKGLILFAALQIAAWFVTAQEARYIIHCYVIAAILGVWGWKFVLKAIPRTGPVLAGLVIACSISYGLAMIWIARAEDVHAAVSSSFTQERKREEIPFLESFDYLNSHASVSKVLVLDPRVPTYYSEKSYVKPEGRWGEQTLPEAGDQNKILASLAEMRISDVMDVRWPGETFRLPEKTPGLTLLFERDDQRIYGVN